MLLNQDRGVCSFLLVSDATRCYLNGNSYQMVLISFLDIGPETFIVYVQWNKKLEMKG